jgi:two-component system response regulator YesN
MILDDEPIVVEGLAYGLDWASLGIDDVYKVYSVAEAMRRIEKNNIDLLITDYRMSDGIGPDVAEFLTQKNKYSKSILISAHDEFSYAQKAISAGVFKYILKPLEYPEVYETVKSALISIGDDIKRDAYIFQLENLNSDIIASARENYLRQIFTTERYAGFEDISAAELEKYKTAIYPHNVLMAVIAKEGENGEQTRAIINIVTSMLEAANLGVDGRADSGLFFRDMAGRMIMPVTFRSAREAHGFAAGNYQILEQAQKQIQSILETGTSLYVSRASSDLHTLHRNYNRLINRITVDKAMGVEPVIYIDIDNSPISPDSPDTSASPARGELSNPARIEKLLEKYKDDIRLCDPLVTTGDLADIFNNSDSIRNSTLVFFHCKYFLMHVYLESFRLFSMNPDALPPDQIEPLYRPELLSTVDQLQAWCCGINQAIIDSVRDKSENFTGFLVSQAQVIVTEGDLRDISLVGVAKQVFVHPSHLSRLFRERTGATFSEYVTSVRMNKAKKLLTGSALKVYEIAEQIGYLSVPHFNTTFKNLFGMTPKEYRDKN